MLSGKAELYNVGTLSGKPMFEILSQCFPGPHFTNLDLRDAVPEQQSRDSYQLTSCHATPRGEETDLMSIPGVCQSRVNHRPAWPSHSCRGASTVDAPFAPLKPGDCFGIGAAITLQRADSLGEIHQAEASLAQGASGLEVAHQAFSLLPEQAEDTLVRACTCATQLPSRAAAAAGAVGRQGDSHRIRRETVLTRSS